MSKLYRVSLLIEAFNYENEDTITRKALDALGKENMYGCGSAEMVIDYGEDKYLPKKNWFYRLFHKGKNPERSVATSVK